MSPAPAEIASTLTTQPADIFGSHLADAANALESVASGANTRRIVLVP